MGVTLGVEVMGPLLDCPLRMPLSPGCFNCYVMRLNPVKIHWRMLEFSLSYFSS